MIPSSVPMDDTDLLPLINASIENESEEVIEPDIQMEQPLSWLNHTTLEDSLGKNSTISARAPRYPRTLRDIAQSGIHRVGESVESVFGRLDTSAHDAVTKTDLVTATALMFILIVGLVFVISVIIIRKCK